MPDNRDICPVIGEGSSDEVAHSLPPLEVTVNGVPYLFFYQNEFLNGLSLSEQFMCHLRVLLTLFCISCNKWPLVHK